MRGPAFILLVAVGCTFDASGIGQTPLTGASGDSSSSSTAGTSSETGEPTSAGSTSGMSGSMTDSNGGPGGDPTTTPVTSSSTSEPETTMGPGTTTDDTSSTATTVIPCETMLMYPDYDKDGFGDPNQPLEVCLGTPNYVPDNTDCDDMSAGVNPGQAEVCDAVDNDCDDRIDEYDAAGNNASCLGCAFKVRDDRLYYFCGSEKSWNDSRQFCIAQMLDLAKPDDKAENDWLVGQLGDEGMYWIAGNDMGAEGTWKWVTDGSAVPAPGEWAANEPNNQGWQIQFNADCMMLLDKNGVIAYPGGGGKWNDHDCGEDVHFICEGPLP